jgi:hypothetical protein
MAMSSPSNQIQIPKIPKNEGQCQKIQKPKASALNIAALGAKWKKAGQEGAKRRGRFTATVGVSASAGSKLNFLIG